MQEMLSHLLGSPAISDTSQINVHNYTRNFISLLNTDRKSVEKHKITVNKIYCKCPDTYKYMPRLL